jgi:hypothetical protein
MQLTKSAWRICEKYKWIKLKRKYDYFYTKFVKIITIQILKLKKGIEKMKTIKVEIKNVYGTESIYPICENAKSFAMLTNTKTFNRAIISIIKQIGIQVEIKQTEI